MFSVALALPIAYWLRYAAGRWRMIVLFLIIGLDVRELPRAHLRLAHDARRATASINSALESIGLIDEPLGFLIFNRFAVTIALVHIFLPYVVLVLYAGLRSRSGPGLLEAAQDLGAGAWLRWRRVDPARSSPRRRVSAFLFVFVLSASDYVTPQFVGGSSGVMLGVQVQANFTTVGNYAARRRDVAADARRPSSRSTSLMRSGLRLARLDRVRFVADGPLAQPARRRLHDRGAALPVRAARASSCCSRSTRRARSRSRSRASRCAGTTTCFAIRGFRDARSEPPHRRRLHRRSSRSLLGHARGLRRWRARARALRGPLALLFFLPITLPGLFIGIALLVFFVALEHQPLAHDRRRSPTSSTSSRTSC